MKKILSIVGILAILLPSSVSAQEKYESIINTEQASHFASLALHCIAKEYPNKTGHVMDDAADVRSPYELHPAFFGCFDWHSAVHGHWMLIRLVKEFPELPERDSILYYIGQNITQENIEAEIEYFSEKTNRSFERTYGWAWLLKLTEELHSWDNQQGKEWFSIMEPLADTIVARYMEFLPKLSFPNRTGEHPNTAFGLSFAWDYAISNGNTEFAELIKKRALEFYLNDKLCPANYEPGGFDFLSPCLQEAALMSKVLPNGEYQVWLEDFLPGLMTGSPDILFEPATVTDRTDGKLVHLDGLNLSRSWCFSEINKTYSNSEGILREAAYNHLKVTIPNIASGDYAGEHWLASFAVYAIFSL